MVKNNKRKEAVLYSSDGGMAGSIIDNDSFAESDYCVVGGTPGHYYKDSVKSNVASCASYKTSPGKK